MHKMAIFLLLLKASHQNLKLVEYQFGDIANGTTTIAPTYSIYTQPSYYAPSTYGGGSAANDPTFLSNGVYIEYNKYIVSDNPIVDEEN